MATNIFLGYPPENIKQFIIDNYSKPVDMTKVPLTFTAEEPNVGIEIHSSEDFYPDNIMLETSINNGSTWQPFVIDETKIILNNVGDSVMFRNSSNTIQSMAEGGGERYTTFILTGGKVAASGNIMFLLDKTGELRDLQKFYLDNAFESLFADCTSLTKAPLLPATVLTDSCYYNMFCNCTSLIQAPELPAETLASSCYWNMFFNCTSLTQVSELPAMTLTEYCYYNMFYSCISLTKAPLLPATTLANWCYGEMFEGCTSLPEPKYNMSHMTFDQVADAIKNDYILYEMNGPYNVQCSNNKILIAAFDEDNWEWIITEG